MSIRGLFRYRHKNLDGLHVNKRNFNGLDMNNNNSFINFDEAMGNHKNNNDSSEVSIIDTVNVDLCMVITFNMKVHDKMKVLMLRAPVRIYLEKVHFYLYGTTFIYISRIIYKLGL
jgi:hypothetical protein